MKLGKLFLQEANVPQKKEFKTPHGTVDFHKVVVENGEYSEFEVWMVADVQNEQACWWLYKNGNFSNTGVPDLPEALIKKPEPVPEPAPKAKARKSRAKSKKES